ncbi:DNA repair protein RecO [candidate division WOR-3 bacterium]|nr:DNA repair protein RecO [candidate division WOR-3 bacterium]
MVSERFFETEGILLRAVKTGERSRSLCFLTQNSGLLWVLARPDSRKTQSADFSCIPSKYHLYLYRTTGNRIYIRESSEKNPYRNIHRDYSKLKTSLHILSPLVKIVQPGASDEFLFKLSDRAFSAIDSSDSEIAALLLVPPYLAILAKHFGFGFPLDSCKKCGSSDVRSISSSEGGFLCAACSDKIFDSKSADAKLLQMTMTSEERKRILSFTGKKTLVALIKSLELYLFDQFSKNTPDIYL